MSNNPEHLKRPDYLDHFIQAIEKADKSNRFQHPIRQRVEDLLKGLKTNSALIATGAVTLVFGYIALSELYRPTQSSQPDQTPPSKSSLSVQIINTNLRQSNSTHEEVLSIRELVASEAFQDWQAHIKALGAKNISIHFIGDNVSVTDTGDGIPNRVRSNTIRDSLDNVLELRDKPSKLLFMLSAVDERDKDIESYAGVRSQAFPDRIGLVLMRDEEGNEYAKYDTHSLPFPNPTEAYRVSGKDVIRIDFSNTSFVNN